MVQYEYKTGQLTGKEIDMANIEKEAKEPLLQRARLLFIRDILLRYTSPDNPISRDKIEEKLASFGVFESRKAFAEDIKALRSFGMDIQIQNGRNAGYWVASRDFELAELELLADAVSASKFLTEKQTKDIINKLGTLCSVDEAKLLVRNVQIYGRNGQLLYNVDEINRALNEKKKKYKIKFKYFSYDVNKEKVYHGDYRVCSPYALVWDKDRYYLVAWNDHRQCYSNYRVDRMEYIQPIDEPARPLDKGFNMMEYISAHFSMFSGEETPVTLRCCNEIASSIFDRFGMDIRLTDRTDSTFCINPTVVPSGPFFAWIFQFEGQIEILEPSFVRDDYISWLKKSLEVHGITSL